MILLEQESTPEWGQEVLWDHLPQDIHDWQDFRSIRTSPSSIRHYHHRYHYTFGRVDPMYIVLVHQSVDPLVISKAVQLWVKHLGKAWWVDSLGKALWVYSLVLALQVHSLEEVWASEWVPEKFLRSYIDNR